MVDEEGACGCGVSRVCVGRRRRRRIGGCGGGAGGRGALADALADKSNGFKRHEREAIPIILRAVVPIIAPKLGVKRGAETLGYTVVAAVEGEAGRVAVSADGVAVDAVAVGFAREGVAFVGAGGVIEGYDDGFGEGEGVALAAAGVGPEAYGALGWGGGGDEGREEEGEGEEGWCKNGIGGEHV